MSRRLVVFSDSLDAPRELLRNSLGASYLICQGGVWDQGISASFQQADLIVLWSATIPQRSAQALDWLRRHATGTPTLAILPEEADSTLVRLASESADDFVLSPIRPTELQQRVERILGSDPDSAKEIARRLGQEFMACGLIGEDPAFVVTLSRIPLAAQVPGL